ncbi:tol-pal system protein YbgF [Marinomonas sp. IMCC 4694]|uniref:tol-pal system protein YbgF n=1 Tax=Marinomonas sp. IMCC 4694 TaxID=2605432 RepID=UPI0011E62DAB|nr:tol-pal system protein YbgF [Marinomonas sp. IMCC 4694]TYL47810.1 tol-pal system protein YbgF [Marinomonas sp. IMCC 4694]
MFRKNNCVRSFAMVLCFTAPFALAQSSQTGAGISANAAAELLFQLETLQQEVQSLRGQLEEQGHDLRLMKESQRDRYIDLDKRISLLMSAPVRGSAQAPSVSLQPKIERVSVQSEPVKISNALTISPLAPVVLPPPTAQSQQAYNTAYNLIRERNFDDAERALAKFVTDFPNDSLTGNGYYWLGEVKLVQGKPKEAIEAFSKVLSDFSGHSKEQDSLYKLGTVNDQLGNSVAAKSYLQDVIKRFPESKAAKLAAGYLSKIK